MRRWVRLVGTLLALPLLGGWEMFRSPDPRVQRGNDAFAQGRYDDAIRAYEEARSALPQEPGVDYDLGAALYQKGLHAPAAEKDGVLERAGAAFQGAARATDPRLAAQAQNGLGSALFRRGKFAQAAQELKKGLRLDPGNREIRHNLELALRRRKEEEQQKQQQDKQDKDKQDKQDKEQQDKDKQPGADGEPPQDPQPQGEGEPPKPDEQGKDGEPKPDEQGKDPKPGDPKDPAKPEEAKADPGKDGKPEDGKDGKPKDGKPEDGKDGKPEAGTPQDGKAGEPRREVDRKLDALERRSRAAQLRRLRARAAQGGRLARPDQDW